MKIRNLIIGICLFATCTAQATDWQACVQYWYYSNVSTNLVKMDKIVDIYATKTEPLFVWKVANPPSVASLVASEPVAVPWWSTYQYTVRETPDWMALKADIAAANATLALYDLTALTNSIAQVTDAKTKAALQDVKAALKQAHNESQAIHKEVKDLKTILGKYLQVEP